MSGNEKLLLSEITLQGIGVLISWNSILTALDWYNNRFPNLDPGFWIPFLNYLPSLIFQPLTIIYGHKFTFNIRINVANIIIAIILVMTPIIVELTTKTTGFICICILTVLMGSANAVGQTSLFGLTGALPKKYTNAAMLGNGLSGLSITIIRLICLSIFPSNSSGYLHSTEVYFIISGCTLIICCVVQLHLMKHPLIIECLSKTHSKEASKIAKITVEDELESFSDSTGYHHIHKEKISYKNLFSKIWQYLFLVWLNFVITFGMLSHVALATDASEMSYPVFSTLMIFVFNFCDVLGRYTPTLHLLKKSMLWVFTISRFVFWVTFILIASDDPSVSPAWLFSWTWFKFVNMALYSYTNGYSCTCSMIHGPSVVSDVYKDKAGYIMVSGLILGIFSGQIISYAFQNIGKVPS
ncbi:hypothetical protein SteCoe_8836 [Stentor coeruleus]|uniref:Equilibrative nucleoside transporter n=1 Tax=Stentor coeruleus TaxID=5963 RepID=A0A1R2CJH9_9CILI|nr:hypothetical protein SteCoe_8836 [Stentor coeruleus]